MPIEDILPDEAAPYAEIMRDGTAVEANVAAVNAVEAVANVQHEPPEHELDTLFTFIGDETTLTKTAAKNTYSEKRAETVASEIAANRMVLIEAEGDDEDDRMRIYGTIGGGTPFSLYGTVAAVEGGYPEARQQLVSAVVKSKLEITVPMGGDWRGLYNEWYRACSTNDRIDTITEDKDRPPHRIAEKFLYKVAGKTFVSDTEEWTNSKHNTVYVTTTDDGSLGSTMFVFMRLLEREAEVGEAVAPRKVVNVLKGRGLVQVSPKELWEVDELPLTEHARVLGLDVDGLISNGLISPDRTVYEEMPR